MVGEPINSKVFFSGIPNDAAGPVADSVTPTLMSAVASAQKKNAAPAAQRNSDFIHSSLEALSGHLASLHHAPRAAAILAPAVRGVNA